MLVVTTQLSYPSSIHNYVLCMKILGKVMYVCVCGRARAGGGGRLDDQSL